MKKLIWIIICLCAATSALAQKQSGIVRTLERPNKPSHGIEGATINVLEYPNAIVSKKGGKFSFEIPGKRQGDSYTLSRVQKKGYSLVDKQMKGRTYAYSSTVPIEIVMVADQQLDNDKKRIEDKAYSRAKKDYDQKLAAIEKQLKEKTISEREYRQKYEQLSNDYNNYVQLIDKMAERYAMTDYKGLSELNREILACIENADLERADSLINSKGDFDKREQELNDKIALKEKSDKLSQQLEKDIEIELGDLVQDYYSKYTIHAANYRNDSAAYYLERIVRFDSTNVEMLFQTAEFIDFYISDYDKAEDYYHRAHSQAIAQYGEQSEKMGEICEKLGLLYDHKLEYDKSLDWYFKALDVYNQVYDKENESLAMTYTLIGRVYTLKKDHEKALEYTLKGLAIREQIFDKENLLLSQSYNNLGVIYVDMKDYDQALDYYKKALAIREQHTERDESISMALSLTNISNIYLRLKKTDEALEYLDRAIEIYERVLGPVNPHTVNAYSVRGRAHISKQEYKEALEWYQKAYDSQVKLYGNDNQEVFKTLLAIGQLHYVLGDDTQAIEWTSKALACAEPIHQNYPDAMTRCHMNLANAYERTGNKVKAFEHFMLALNLLEKLEGTSPEVINQLKNHIETLKGSIPK